MLPSAHQFLPYRPLADALGEVVHRDVRSREIKLLHGRRWPPSRSAATFELHVRAGITLSACPERNALLRFIVAA